MEKVLVFTKGDRVKAVKDGKTGTVISAGTIWMSVHWDNSSPYAVKPDLDSVFTNENGNESFELLKD